MRRFLNTSHVISRILLYLCVIGVLLLYFFKPGILIFVQRFLPQADNGSWLALVTALSIAAVMFAASELAYKSLTDNEFMITLSSSVLKQAYGRYDLSDKRFSKPAAGEFEFNASLRDVTDGQERVMHELAWEKQHNKKLQKKIGGNKLVTLLFFIAGIAFLLYPFVFYPVTGRLLTMPTGTALDFFSLVAIILTMFLVFENGNNQGQTRRLNTILSIRSRSDELSEKPALPAAVPEPVPANTVPFYEAPKPAPQPAAPVPQEEAWKPEPAWTGVPEEMSAEEKPQGSAFVNLTPEEEKPEA